MHRAQATQFVRRSQFISGALLAVGVVLMVVPTRCAAPESSVAAAPRTNARPVGPAAPETPRAAELAKRLTQLLPAQKPLDPPKVDVVVTPDKNAGPPPPPPPPPPAPVRYLGSITNREFRRAVVVLNGVSQRLLAEGDALDATHTLKSILPTALLIVDANGVESRVELATAAPGAPGTPGTAGTRPAPGLASTPPSSAIVDAGKSDDARRRARAARPGSYPGADAPVGPVAPTPNPPGSPGAAPQRTPANQPPTQPPTQVSLTPNPNAALVNATPRAEIVTPLNASSPQPIGAAQLNPKPGISVAPSTSPAVEAVRARALQGRGRVPITPVTPSTTTTPTATPTTTPAPSAPTPPSTSPTGGGG